MADFQMKKWLDDTVVPLTTKEPQLRLYSFIWNGNPPKEILVWLLAGSQPVGVDAGLEPPTDDSFHHDVRRAADADPDPDKKPVADSIRANLEAVEFDPAAWPRAVKRLLEEDGFRFDYLREQQMVQLENGLVPVFGGDGAPIFGKEGTASARLFKKTEDGIGLIVQIGCHYPATDEHNPGRHAASAVKGFFSLFEDNPMVVCQKFGAPFGAA